MPAESPMARNRRERWLAWGFFALLVGFAAALSWSYQIKVPEPAPAKGLPVYRE